MLLNSGIHIR